MAGIIPNVALVNNFDANGFLMSGALLRIYEAGTLNEVVAYKDSALTTGQEHPWPIVADAAGRLPMFWVDDGQYRVRLSSSDGSFIAYDIASIAAMGEASGEGGGGGGVSSEVVYQTGDLKPRYGTGVHAGFVRGNGRTIGSASSGASERAAADTQSLFEHLWAASPDAILPVSGGRGASAAADFLANKTIALPDFRGCPIVGLDDMGNSAAGRLTTATFSTSGQGPTVLGALGGSQTQTLTQAQLPAFKPAITITDPGHEHDVNNIGVALIQNVGPGAQFGVLALGNTTTEPATTGITAALTDNLGSGEGHSNVQPSRLATIYIKL